MGRLDSGWTVVLGLVDECDEGQSPAPVLVVTAGEGEGEKAEGGW